MVGAHQRSTGMVGNPNPQAEPAELMAATGTWAMLTLAVSARPISWLTMSETEGRFIGHCSLLRFRVVQVLKVQRGVRKIT
jgi:hypothetical protein